jgi:sugar-specific transcriptional regulator TrmB
MSNQQVYRCLKSMRAKGLVSATFERPALFSAVSLEKVLDQVMKAKMGQAKNLQSNREELLSSWRSMIQKDSANS